MKHLVSIIITIFALFALVLPASAEGLSSQLHPYFNILEVLKDQTVTIQVFNFPANDNFRVTMGAYGSYGIGGVVIGFTDSGNGGSFTATYTIPSTLAGSERIAIRLQSPTSGYFAYNWFWNNPVSSPTSTPIPGYSGFPTFSIKSVIENQSVTIITNNFPPNDTFTVTMGKFGTLGIGGVVVDSTKSGNGGVFEVTYTIPSGLMDLSRIAIRMQSPTTGYFAYNWFFNNTATATPTLEPTPSPTPQPTPTATPTPPGYSGFPTFSISAVVKDQTVTISGKNFPTNDTFTVLMGKYGTKGIGGINAGSTNTGAGGALSATYNIPASLAGETRIAIRLQSPTSGYFAYNWFWNNTTP
jgi:hypothetical protein